MIRRLTLATVLFIVGLISAAAQVRVGGTVTSSEDGGPVDGATVVVEGTNLVTITDAAGKFSFNSVPASAHNVKVSYIGMNTATVRVGQNLRIQLTPNTQQLSETVVVAYGTQKRQALTGSVTTINSERLAETIGSSATGALEGSSPGIQVNNTYGQPGTEPTIRIRGFSSVNGINSPLYVVDGVPFSGNMADISPSDIESISVLKDAASAALYGNRASNGVILITTKKGKGLGKTSLTLTMNQGLFTRGISEYDRLAANPWMEAQWTGLRNSYISGSNWDESTANAYTTANIIENLIKRNIYNAADDARCVAHGGRRTTQKNGYTDLDWWDALKRTGHRQEYVMSGSTAGEKYNVYSSIGYLNEEGYILSSDFERYTGRFNANYSPTSWLTAGMNLAGSMQKSNFLAEGGGSYYANPFSQSRYMAPVYPLYLHNADGSYNLDADGNRQYDLTSDYLSSRHIVYELLNNKTTRKRNTLNGQVYATFKLPYNFEFTVRGTLERNNTNTELYENPNVGDGASNNGRMQVISSSHQSYTGQQLLTWGRDFGKHHVDVLLGHENYNTDSTYNFVMNTNMGVEGLIVLSNFTTNSSTVGFSRQYRTESWLGRVRYNFSDKYYGDFSFRRDGSSRFHKDNRWGNFFSIGGNWNITAEEFMKPYTWVNELKLRASYGEVGNDASVGYYGYMALYDLVKNAGSTALVRQTLSAEDIKWETTQTVDIALEGRLFDRLSFSIGYFDKRSKDLLFAVEQPLSAGSYPFNSSSKNLTINQNIGTVSNRGLEVSLDYDAIRNRDWKWTVGVDATLLKNKIVQLPDTNDIAYGTMRMFSEGHSIYEFYTYHFEGVDQMTGRSLYTLNPSQKTAAENAGHLVTINGVDYTTNTTYGKRDWAGSALPDIYGSIRSSLKWKNLTFNTLFTYSLGGKVYDYSYRSLMTTSTTSVSALHTDILKSWTAVPAGMTETSANRIDANGTPILDHNLSTYNNAVSDRWLFSASYFSIKNINLSYDLPKRLLGNSGIESLRITAGIENLATITARKGLNPQQSYNGATDDSFSVARVYNLGVVLNF